MSGVAVMQIFFEFVGVACVLASGLMPVYALNSSTLTMSAECDLGVWRTTCTWWANQTTGTPDMPTYNLPFVHGAWVAPVMEAVYTIALVLGIATMVWQVAAARSALLQAKAHGQRHCGWVLPLFTALLGGVYLLLVRHFGTHFWVTYTDDDGLRVTVRTSDEFFPLITKPGFFVACAGVISFVASLLILCIEACLTKPAPLKTVAVNPEESQPIVGQVVNKAVYHTCA